MTKPGQSVVVLMADDDPDDRFLTKEAFAELQLDNELRFVHDGEQLIDYLYRRGLYSDPDKFPLPGLILLDLNMPKKGGLEALKEIKAGPNLCDIPIVILTTSKSEDDILRAYEAGANSFLIKPVSFEALLRLVKILTTYWFEIVELPRVTTRGGINEAGV
jgi:CheY-like chemotaxis protein